MICRSLRSSFRSLSTLRSRWSHSFLMRGNTSTIRVSTCSAFRSSMYSFESRQSSSDLRILQCHLKTTLTKSSYDAFLPLAEALSWKVTEKPGWLAHSLL